VGDLFWDAVATAVVGTFITGTCGFLFIEARARFAASRLLGQLYANLGDGVATNVQNAMHILDELRAGRTPATNLFSLEAWRKVASLLPIGHKYHLHADIQHFFELCDRTNELVRTVNSHAELFNVEADRAKQDARLVMLKTHTNNLASLCRKIVDDGRYVMQELGKEPAWLAHRKRHPKPKDGSSAAPPP
jgi:hypothetical protein